MKTIVFSLILLLSITLSANDTIRSLVITEARLDFDDLMYLEITNMGDQDLQLDQFEIGKTINLYQTAPYQPHSGHFFRFPNKILKPGDSFLVCAAKEYGPEQFALGKIGTPEPYPERTNKPDLISAADMVFHQQETWPLEKTDSVTENWQTLWGLFYGQVGFFIEQHLPNGDSVIIDVVNGPRPPLSGWPSVAGVNEASKSGILVRKFIVKTGNTDFINARGIGEGDSEWMVIPIQVGLPNGAWRKVHWTVGNHLDAHISQNTLQSEIAIVDYPNQTITVPWGTRRADDIINYFEKKPGIAWNYHCSNEPGDSLFSGAKTGDKLEIFACGNKLERKTFTIVVAEPQSNANIVIPKFNRDPRGQWRNKLQDVMVDWPRVTRNENNVDTIWGFKDGIPYATRTDSLLDRLELPQNASYEFIFIDESTQRVDLKNGDILKITAENGETKEYYISVKNYEPSNEALLSSITWPDIPEYYKNIFGWKNDTIPGFNPSRFNYHLKVPYDYTGIPALVAKTKDHNATVSAIRATSVVGTEEQRTITITVTAENDTSLKIYTIELIKELAPENVQPFVAEPFLSEHVFWHMWSHGFIEICNPGNQPLDLSNYMFSFVWGYPEDGIKWYSDYEDWPKRYDKYVPGYKWVNKFQWEITPGRLVRDLSVNPIIMPGDVFVAGHFTPYYFNSDILKEVDIMFDNWHSPWGWEEPYDSTHSAAKKWRTATWYMYKILNDSIKLGLKAANNPDDFELIETFGHGEVMNWNIGGKVPDMLTSIIRKPEYHIPKKGLAESFGDSLNSEWILTGLAERKKTLPDQYWHFGATLDIGRHVMNEVTYYKSTVSSGVYKVSEGFSKKENILGVITGTTASEFITNIIKADSNQVLNLISRLNGNLVQNQDLISDGDTLKVVSADSTNTTNYIISVSDKGLSSNAVLTSIRYEINISINPKSNSDFGRGEIEDIEYGTTLKAVLNNVNVPDGAILNIFSKDTTANNEKYVSLILQNENDDYIDVIVKPDIYFEVIAEDGKTIIHYVLKPEVSESDAFILSDDYLISQKEQLIKYIPRGTNLVTFFSKIVASLGASVKVVNKFGLERKEGVLVQDDKVVVTSPNGAVVKVYYLSMLATQYIPETTYLAYILSDVYGVDQVTLFIKGASGTAPIAEFYSNIRVADGATAVLIDPQGNEKLSGDIDGGDRVKVTSFDGKHEVWYNFGTLTNTKMLENSLIRIYPNPTTGEINIAGIEPGNIIKIFDLTGRVIKEEIANSPIYKISLSGELGGLYILNIYDDAGNNYYHKIIKQ